MWHETLMTRCNELLLSEVSTPDTFDQTDAFIDSEILSREVEEPSAWFLGPFSEIIWTCRNVDDGTACIDPAELLQPSVKPDVSFARMIREAINESTRKRLFLSEIYEDIVSKHVYYRNNNHNGWKVVELQLLLYTLF